jgi:hypothetical protein
MNDYYEDYLASFHKPHPAEERSIVPMVIAPKATTMRQLRRGINKLLSKGYRCRGDIRVLV